MKENKVLQVLLILLVLLIWSGVFYRAFHTMPGKNTDLSSQNALDPAAEEKYPVLPDRNQDFSRLKNKDPFRPFRETGAPGSSIKILSQKSQTVPAYLLKGIVWDEKEPKAILIKSRLFADSDPVKLGETLIVTIGQALDHGKVLEITENYVIISSGGQKYKLWSDLWQPIQ